MPPATGDLHERVRSKSVLAGARPSVKHFKWLHPLHHDTMLSPWGNLFMGSKILNKEELKNITDHKYQAGVYTPLDNFLNPYWLQLTEMLPRWLAPNLVTFAGFVPLLTCYVLAWYCSSVMDKAPPRWLCFMMAVALFLYQTLDAMDGKQARRVGQSTPLGQLFDHGCDCLALLSHHSMAAGVFCSGGTTWTLAGFAVLATAFFMAQWQEHYTGVLCTSFGPVGVTETQYALIALVAFAGVLGPDRVEGMMLSGVFGLTLGKFFIVLWIIFNFGLMGFCMYGTMTQQAEEGGVAINKFRAVQDLLPILALNFVFLFGWDATVVADMPRVLSLSAGLLFFYMTAQMIVFSMARSNFQRIQWMMLPFAALAFASRVAYLPFEMLLVKVSLVIHTVAMTIYVLYWIMEVVSELTAHLGIRVFTIEPKAE